MRKIIEDKLKKSSEIIFRENFELYEERKFQIWNYIERKNETYIIKKEDPDSYSLYLDYKKLANSIFDYFGIWSDLSDDQFKIITESINNIRKNIMKRYYPDLPPSL